MKKHSLIVLLLVILSTQLNAAEYLKGKMVDWNKTETEIFYDRTQVTISAVVFQSVYKVFDAGKKLQSTVTITHDRSKEMMFVSIKPEGTAAKGYAIRYDSEVSGLIFSDISNVDTGYNLMQAYRYVVSFADANRDYPIVHKIRTDKGQDILMDPVSRIRLKMHRDMVKNIPAANIEAVTHEPTFNTFYNLTQNDALSAELLKMRNGLYALNQVYTDSVSRWYKAMQVQVDVRVTDKKVKQDERNYFGEMAKGKANGPGLLIEKGNIYQGVFVMGSFISGLAVIKTDNFKYEGQYANNAYTGMGWLSQSNGSYLLGIFKNSVIETGIALSKSETGETYFGSFKNNQRNGYGELRNNNNLYFGEFVEGKLVRGYTKEVDQFGYATYSRIEGGKKAPADLKMAEDFFNSVVASNN